MLSVTWQLAFRPCSLALLHRTTVCARPHLSIRLRSQSWPRSQSVASWPVTRLPDGRSMEPAMPTRLQGRARCHRARHSGCAPDKRKPERRANGRERRETRHPLPRGDQGWEVKWASELAAHGGHVTDSQTVSQEERRCSNTSLSAWTGARVAATR